LPQNDDIFVAFSNTNKDGNGNAGVIVPLLSFYISLSIIGLAVWDQQRKEYFGK
jgi:hypothetical protein